MNNDTNIRTLKNGSIDYAHYIARSHEIRSNDTHQFLARVWGFLKSIGKGKQAQTAKPVANAKRPRPSSNRVEVRSTATRHELPKAS